MLPESIRSLILDEQARLNQRFIGGVDLDVYLGKIGARAEWLSDTTADRCRGCVAFYCNDNHSRQAYITLVLVEPASRGTGLGRALVAGVLAIAKGRGFTVCRLEAAKGNTAAHALYRSLGFRVADDRGDKELWEIAL